MAARLCTAALPSCDLVQVESWPNPFQRCALPTFDLRPTMCPERSVRHHLGSHSATAGMFRSSFDMEDPIREIPNKHGPLPPNGTCSRPRNKRRHLRHAEPWIAVTRPQTGAKPIPRLMEFLLRREHGRACNTGATSRKECQGPRTSTRCRVSSTPSRSMTTEPSAISPLSRSIVAARSFTAGEAT